MAGRIFFSCLILDNKYLKIDILLDKPLLLNLKKYPGFFDLLLKIDTAKHRNYSNNNYSRCDTSQKFTCNLLSSMIYLESCKIVYKIKDHLSYLL